MGKLKSIMKEFSLRDNITIRLQITLKVKQLFNKHQRYYIQQHQELIYKLLNIL